MIVIIILRTVTTEQITKPILITESNAVTNNTKEGETNRSNKERKGGEHNGNIKTSHFMQLQGTDNLGMQDISTKSSSGTTNSRSHGLIPALSGINNSDIEDR